jgi:hypothetical protein
MATSLAKNLKLREADYWVYALSLVNVIILGSGLWVGTLKMRLPLLAVGGLCLWFTANKIARDYTPHRARFHIAVIVLAACLLGLSMYLLMN